MKLSGLVLAAGLLLLTGCTPAAPAPAPMPVRPSATPRREATPTLTPSPSLSPIIRRTLEPGKSDYTPPKPVSCPAATVRVSTVAALRQAVTGARAGTVIALAPGTYRVRLTVTGRGTAGQPIFLCGAGAGRTVIDAGGLDAGTAITFRGARYWRVIGLGIRNARTGVSGTGTGHVVLQQLQISGTGWQGVWWREHSSDNLVRETTIEAAGLSDPRRGQGVLVGTPATTWCQPTRCEADESDRDVVLGSTFRRTRAAAVQAYEGSYAGVVLDNDIDGRELTGADPWVEIRGSDWAVTRNTGRHAPRDGYRSRVVVEGLGTSNTFRTNTGRDLAEQRRDGVLVALRPDRADLVACDNTVADRSAPRTNGTCRG